MLRKLFSILFTLILIFTSGAASAQENDSAFAELSGKENRILIKNTTVSEYRGVLEGYDELLTNYQKSFGSTKAQLEEDVTSMSKRILALKLGVVKARVEDFQSEFNKMEFTQEEKQEVQQIVSDLKTYLDSTEDDINEITSLTEATNLSEEINTSLSETFDELQVYSTMFSIEKGLEIINSLKPYIQLINQHLEVALEAGVVLDKVTETYSTTLLDLEEAEARYLSLGSVIQEEGFNQDQVDQVQDLNKKVRSAFYTVQETVETLMFRYGETPWSLE